MLWRDVVVEIVEFEEDSLVYAFGIVISKIIEVVKFVSVLLELGVFEFRRHKIDVVYALVFVSTW